MSKIYTKYGDKGYTFTKFDPQTPKNHYIVNFLGELDELNSSLGLLSAQIINNDKLKESALFLQEIMDVCFSLGAFVGYGTKIPENKFDEIVNKIETLIDIQEKENGKLKNFILPTGHVDSALGHVCRSICRRVERNIYNLESKNSLKLPSVFLNRLGDYLFSLARTINKVNDCQEIIWENK